MIAGENLNPRVRHARAKLPFVPMGPTVEATVLHLRFDATNAARHLAAKNGKRQAAISKSRAHTARFFDEAPPMRLAGRHGPGGGQRLLLAGDGRQGGAGVDARTAVVMGWN